LLIAPSRVSETSRSMPSSLSSHSAGHGSSCAGTPRRETQRALDRSLPRPLVHEAEAAAASGPSPDPFFASREPLHFADSPECRGVRTGDIQQATKVVDAPATLRQGSTVSMLGSLSHSACIARREVADHRMTWLPSPDGLHLDSNLGGAPALVSKSQFMPFATRTSSRQFQSMSTARVVCAASAAKRRGLRAMTRHLVRQSDIATLDLSHRPITKLLGVGLRRKPLRVAHGRPHTT
jgi:hypothetical protein